MNNALKEDRPGWMQSVLREHESSLIRYAARLTGDPDLARDVTQDVFLRLCREDPAALNGRLRPWLYTVCRNRALELRRKHHRSCPPGIRRSDFEAADDNPPRADGPSLSPANSGAASGSGGNGLVADVGMGFPDPAEAVERAETNSRVLRVLAGLPPNQQFGRITGRGRVFDCEVALAGPEYGLRPEAFVSTPF